MFNSALHEINNSEKKFIDSDIFSGRVLTVTRVSYSREVVNMIMRLMTEIKK